MEADYKVKRVENGWILTEASSFGRSWLCSQAADIGKVIGDEFEKAQKRKELNSAAS